MWSCGLSQFFFKSPSINVFKKCFCQCPTTRKYEIGDTAIVTGGTMGIGLECVKALLKAGVPNIMVGDISIEKGIDAMKPLRRRFARSTLEFMKCDVTQCRDMKNLFQTALDIFGNIDIVVNNAGVANEALWEMMLDINLKAVILGSQMGMNVMGIDRGGKGGTIINVSSVLGLQPLAGSPVHVATKHAVIGYTRSLAMPFHHERTHVRVMAMCPGITNTQLMHKMLKDPSPLGRIAAREIIELPEQHVCHTGICLIRMLREGAPGSVWVTEDKEIYEVTLPDRLTFHRRC